jgi:hypothetical protein
LCACIHIDHRARQHAQLADPVEGAGLHAGQSGEQIDEKEGKDRHQAQGEQIEGALPLHPFVDRLQALAEALLDPVTEQEARDQESQRGADRRCEGDDHHAPQEAEDGATGQRQQGGAGQRQRRHDDVCGKVEGNTEAGIICPEGLDGLLLRLECLQVEVLAQVECDVQTDD